MKKPNRRQVSLRIADFEMVTALRDALAEKSGRMVTLSDTVARALLLPARRPRTRRLA